MMPSEPCPPNYGLCDNEVLKTSQYVIFTRNNKLSLLENGKRYIIENINNECIARIKIDGGILASDKGKRADYAIIRCESDILYVIELKGCDIAKACEQVLSTIILLKNLQISCENTQARIVCSRVPSPALRSSSYHRLRKVLKSNSSSLQISRRCCIEKYE